VEEAAVVKNIIKRIVENNRSFASGRGRGYFEPHMKAQHPDITLVTCCDSRVQPTVIEPDPIDRVFTVETIGNQMTSAQGSVDYGVLHLHTPVLLILGHTDCGALKAYMKGYDKENDAIKAELDNLRPALPAPGGGVQEDRLMSNTRANVLYQVSRAVNRYRRLVDEGTLTVIGAIYDFTNALGKGSGRVLIITVNGITEKERLTSMPALAGFDLEECLGV